MAEKLAQLRSLEGGQEGAIQPQDYRHALREVVARCIYGVDRNPMAIELARMALWLEGYEEGRPLGFRPPPASGRRPVGPDRHERAGTRHRQGCLQTLERR